MVSGNNKILTMDKDKFISFRLSEEIKQEIEAEAKHGQDLFKGVGEYLVFLHKQHIKNRKCPCCGSVLKIND